jgi:hypothetical protein
MLIGGKKYSKPQKTKFRRNTDNEPVRLNQKTKHKDKSTYRLLRNEEKEYVN